jgi:hypothetical protein
MLLKSSPTDPDRDQDASLPQERTRVMAGADRQGGLWKPVTKTALPDAEPWREVTDKRAELER